MSPQGPASSPFSTILPYLIRPCTDAHPAAAPASSPTPRPHVQLPLAKHRSPHRFPRVLRVPPHSVPVVCGGKSWHLIISEPPCLEILNFSYFWEFPGAFWGKTSGKILDRSEFCPKNSWKLADTAAEIVVILETGTLPPHRHTPTAPSATPALVAKQRFCVAAASLPPASRRPLVCGRHN